MGLNINLEFDSAALAAPAAFRTAIQQAASMLDAAIANPITVNIEIEYGEDDVDALTGVGITNVTGGDYSTVRADLIANAAPGDPTFNALPATSPFNGGVTLSYAEEQLFGMLPATGSTIDGVADFGTDISPDEIVPAALDILTRVLGRNPASASGSAGAGSLFDLFRFTGEGVRMGYTPNPSNNQIPASYFSVDNGVTNLANYDRLGGYAFQTSGDPFSGTGPGEVQHLTNLDLEQLNALGFDTVLPRRRPPSDFNGDKLSEVLLRNASGSFADWTMNGSAVTASTLLTAGGNAVTLSSAWTVDGVADLSGDGKSDVLLRNSNGTLADWTMNGSQISASQLLTSQGATVTLGPAWSVSGLGDFNGDGKSDVLLRNSNGTFADWTMNGSQIASSQLLTSQGATETLGSAWSVAGIGDFNGDGLADLLLRNANGTFADWSMNGSKIASSQLLTAQGATVTLGSAWSVAGVGDFNGDGLADVLLRNSNGTLADWTMNGSKIASSQLLTSGGATVTLDPSWSIAALGDFNGDGKSDILLRNTSGAFVEWTMNGSAITAAAHVTANGQTVAAPAWQVQASPADLPFG